MTVKKEKVKNPVMDRETAFLDACSGVSCLVISPLMAKMMKSNKEFDMHVTENNRI